MIELKYIPGTTCKCLLDQFCTYNYFLDEGAPNRSERREGRKPRLNADYMCYFLKPEEAVPYFESIIDKETRKSIIDTISNELGPFSKSSSLSKVLLFKNHGAYCPECIKSFSSYYNQQLITEDTCKIHNSKLITRCPKCGKEFDYIINIGTKNPYRCRGIGCNYVINDCTQWELVVEVNRELNNRNYEKYYKHIDYPDERGYLCVFQTTEIESSDCIKFLKKYLDSGQRAKPSFSVNVTEEIKPEIQSKIQKFILEQFRTNVYGENIHDILYEFENIGTPEYYAASLLIRKAFDFQVESLYLVNGSTIQTGLITAIKKSGIENAGPIVDKLLDIYIEDFYRTSVYMFRLYDCSVDELRHSKNNPIEVGYEIVILERNGKYDAYIYKVSPLRLKSL